MKPFKYPLETLLSVRKVKEKEELNNLAILNGEKARLCELMEKLKIQQKKQEDLVFKLDPLSPDSYEMQKGYYHLEYLVQIESVRIKKQLAEINEKIQNQQKLILEKSREKKVVERLKEKAFSLYNVELRREESRINDDNNQSLAHWKNLNLA